MTYWLTLVFSQSPLIKNGTLKKECLYYCALHLETTLPEMYIDESDIKPSYHKTISYYTSVEEIIESSANV